jgi:hypothetical protein
MNIKNLVEREVTVTLTIGTACGMLTLFMLMKQKSIPALAAADIDACERAIHAALRADASSLKAAMEEPWPEDISMTNSIVFWNKKGEPIVGITGDYLDSEQLLAIFDTDYNRKLIERHSGHKVDNTSEENLAVTDAEDE